MVKCLKVVTKIKTGKISIECDTLEQFEEFKEKAKRAGYIIEKEKIQDFSDIMMYGELDLDMRNYFITFILKKV